LWLTIIGGPEMPEFQDAGRPNPDAPFPPSKAIDGPAQDSRRDFHKRGSSTPGEALSEDPRKNPVPPGLGEKQAGTRPVEHQRVDLEASSDRAQMLALYSNRVGELNLDWNAEVIAGLNMDLSKLWSQDELAEILKKAAGGAGAEPDETELCPTCGRPLKARKRE